MTGQTAQKKTARDRRSRRAPATRRPLRRNHGLGGLTALACVCVAATLGSGFAPTGRALAGVRDDSHAAEIRSDARSAGTNVGFVVGHGEPSTDGQLSGVADALREIGTVVDVRLSEGAAALKDIDVVIVAGGPDIPDAELYVLDQFLMRGGRAAFLLDAAVVPETGTQANLSEGNIFGFLSTYGITVNPDLVLDDECADGASWGDVSTSSAYPYWPLVRGAGVAREHPAMSGVDVAHVAWTSSIETRPQGTGSARATVLLRSSADSWTVSAFTSLDPSLGFKRPGPFDDDYRVAGEGGFTLAVAVEGRLGSAFAGQKVIVQRGGKVEFTEPPDMVETSAPTRMVVFGSSMMFRDDLAAQLPGNADLLVGVVDWLASGEEPESGVTTDHGREWTPRRNAVALLAIAVLAAAVAALVGLVASRRKKR